MEKGSEVRKADYPINEIFLNRWSPRAMSGESISDEELMTLFEAARWAPSASNEQPWRFIYARSENKEQFDKFFGILDDFNQLWAGNAAALVCLCAYKKTKDDKENRNFMSDTGSAWENLALQGSLLGLVVHGMAGYDVEKARKELNIPEDYEIVHMIAIGKSGDLDKIPERMRKSEHPNERKPIGEFVFEGEFKNS